MYTKEKGNMHALVPVFTIGFRFRGNFFAVVVALLIYGVFPHVRIVYDVLLGLPFGAALSVLLGKLMLYLLDRSSPCTMSDRGGPASSCLPSPSYVVWGANPKTGSSGTRVLLTQRQRNAGRRQGIPAQRVVRRAARLPGASTIQIGHVPDRRGESGRENPLLP